MDERLELEGVPVAFGALGHRVLAGKRLLALRAQPRAAVDILNVDLYLKRFVVDLHLGHWPGSRQAENVLVEFGIEHGAGLLGVEASPLPGSSAKYPDGPSLFGSCPLGSTKNATIKPLKRYPFGEESRKILFTPFANNCSLP